MSHYTDGRRWSHISKMWILESDWNASEEIAMLKGQLEEAKKDAERYRDYARRLMKFVESVDFEDDDAIPSDVWAIVQHWNNDVAIDAAIKGEKE